MLKVVSFNWQPLYSTIVHECLKPYFQCLLSIHQLYVNCLKKLRFEMFQGKKSAEVTSEDIGGHKSFDIKLRSKKFRSIANVSWAVQSS